MRVRLHSARVWNGRLLFRREQILVEVVVLRISLLALQAESETCPNILVKVNELLPDTVDGGYLAPLKVPKSPRNYSSLGPLGGARFHPSTVLLVISFYLQA